MDSDEVQDPDGARSVVSDLTPPPGRVRAPRTRSVATPEAPDASVEPIARRRSTLHVGESISPHVPPPLPEKPSFSDRVRQVDLRLLLAAISGLLGTLVIVGTAPIRASKFVGQSWYLEVPFIKRPPSSAGLSWNSSASLTQAGTFVIGLTLVCLGWIGLVRRAERTSGSSRRRAKIVLAVCALWAAPVLLGPPLLSNDSYSYAAQGEMTAQGLDPTAVGPAIGLGQGEFVAQVDGFWRTAPAPYGPVWVLAGGGAVIAAGHDPVLSVWAFRLIAFFGVALSAVGMISLARSYRTSVPVALAIGIGNPLVILHLLGGNHNDALMMGFLVCGVAAAKRDRRWVAVALLTFATAIKLPAIVALGIYAWQFEGAKVPFRKRVLGLAKVGAFAAGSIAVLCVFANIGLGWVSALKSTGKVMDTMSVTTLSGYFLGDIAHFFGIGLNSDKLVNGIRMIGVLFGAGLAFKLLISSGKVGLARAIGLSMILMVIFGPVVWPWYFPAGFALLAGSGLGKWRPSYLIGCILASALVWPNNIVAPGFLTENQRRLMLAVCVITAVTCWLAQRHAARHGRYLADEARIAEDVVAEHAQLGA